MDTAYWIGIVLGWLLSLAILHAIVASAAEAGAERALAGWLREIAGLLRAIGEHQGAIAIDDAKCRFCGFSFPNVANTNCPKCSKPRVVRR